MWKATHSGFVIKVKLLSLFTAAATATIVVGLTVSASGGKRILRFVTRVDKQESSYYSVLPIFSCLDFLKRVSNLRGVYRVC